MAGVRVTESGDRRITEAGDVRIIEEPPKNEGCVRMAFVPFDDKAVFRTQAQGLPNLSIVTFMWRVFYDAFLLPIELGGGVHFATPFSIAKSSPFTSDARYIVCFSNQVSNPPVWALGNNGDDALASDVVQIGKFYTQCYQRFPIGGGLFRNLFYYDITDVASLSKVIVKDGPAFPAYESDHVMMFGSVPYTDQEGLNGRMCGILASETLWTQPEIIKQATNFFPKIPKPFWGVWPLLNHNDLSDYSGNGRHLTAQNTLSTALGPELPNTAAPIQPFNTGTDSFIRPVTGNKLKVTLPRLNWPSGQVVVLANEYTFNGTDFFFLNAMTCDGGQLPPGRNGEPEQSTVEMALPAGAIEVKTTLIRQQPLTTGVEVETF